MSALVVALATLVSAQASQLSGTVRDQAGNILPGVTVTLKGPALEKLHVTVTDVHGTFTFKNLPVDDGYVVTFSLVNFCPVVQRNVTIGADREATTNAVIRFEACREQNPTSQSGGGILLLSAREN
jgi:hypothetical protein